MDLLLILIVFIVGLIFGHFLPAYLSKKGQNLATKEDIAKITTEIEAIKNIFKDQYDLSKSEREFYEKIAGKIYKFLAIVKKYEFENKPNVLTREAIFENAELKSDYFEFIDNANEFIGKSYIFLKEENYQNLKDAFPLGDKGTNFAKLCQDLLHSMRRSIYSNTKLEPDESLKEFNY